MMNNYNDLLQDQWSSIFFKPFISVVSTLQEKEISSDMFKLIIALS